MDSAFWVAIIGAVSLGITQITHMILSYLREKHRVERDRVMAVKVEAVKDEVEVTAAKVETVKNAVELTNAVTDAKLDTIHVLVNSAMGRALKLTAETARAKANITHTTDDLAAAELAEKLSHEHDTAQMKIDAAK